MACSFSRQIALTRLELREHVSRKVGLEQAQKLPCCPQPDVLGCTFQPTAAKHGALLPTQRSPRDPKLDPRCAKARGRCLHLFVIEKTTIGLCRRPPRTAPLPSVPDALGPRNCERRRTSLAVSAIELRSPKFRACHQLSNLSFHHSSNFSRNGPSKAQVVPREAPLPSVMNMDLTCSNIADDSGCFWAQEATDDRGIHRTTKKETMM